jgi:threonine dehydrogenase-like Zn-dependent dehydrogenase
MEKGDILGHEFMGEIVEVGSEVKKLRQGERVVVAFPISCGKCFFCARELFSLCDNSNPNAWMAQKLYGQSPAGLYGYTHMLGGFAGGQAEYARVPFADVGTIKIPNGLTDEQVLFLSDIFPTGYMAAENCSIQPGIRSPSGVAGRLGSSRFGARFYSERSAFSPSTVFPNASAWPMRARRRRSTMKTWVSMTL